MAIRRSSIQIKSHAQRIVKKWESGVDIFHGLKENENDFYHISQYQSDADSVVQTLPSGSMLQRIDHAKRGRPKMPMVIAPTVSSGSRKRHKASTEKIFASTSVTCYPDLLEVLSAPYAGHGVDALVIFSPLMNTTVDKERIVGCERLEKCGCVIDVYLEPSAPVLCLERIVFVIRRRLETAYKTRRRPTTALTDAIFRLLCQQTDDFDDILAACARLQQQKPIVGTLVGEDEVEWWAALSNRPAIVAPLRRFAFLRRLAMPVCARSYAARRASCNGAAASPTMDPSEEMVCFPDFSLLDVLLRIEITQGAVIDGMMLRIVQLECAIDQVKEESKPLVRELQRCLLSSINEATGIKCFDRAQFISSAQFMLIMSNQPPELNRMVSETLSNVLSAADIDADRLENLEMHFKWFSEMTSSWNIPTDRLKDWRGNPLGWTERPAIVFGRSTPSETSEEETSVQLIRQVLLGKKDAHELMREWNLEKLQKKTDMLVGRNDGSALVVTLADMTLETFLHHTALMNKVNESFAQPLNRPGARPRLQSLDISEASLSKIKSTFFDADGSLRNEMKNDIEMTLKHGYINFQNTACSDARNDKRWQLPIKQHCQGTTRVFPTTH